MLKRVKLASTPPDPDPDADAELARLRELFGPDERSPGWDPDAQPEFEVEPGEPNPDRFTAGPEDIQMIRLTKGKAKS